MDRRKPRRARVGIESLEGRALAAGVCGANLYTIDTTNPGDRPAPAEVVVLESAQDGQSASSATVNHIKAFSGSGFGELL